MDRKQLPFVAVESDLEAGIVAGYAAIMGNVDDWGDVIHPGAFSKTLQERGGRVRVLWQHDAWEPIGKPLLMEEHGRDRLPDKVLARAPEAVGGLFTKTQISATQRGRDALVLIGDGVIDELSIGYDAVKFDFDDDRVRNLREIRLWEYSPVTWAANVGAVLVKSVVPFQDLPLADEDRAWDATAAEGRVRSWAGGGDSLEDMDWGKYRKAFVWYDRENAEKVGGYKLQIGDIIEGRLTAVPRGVFAAAAALQGARGGVDIPDADKEKARAHLGRYYDKMDRDPPWKRSPITLVAGGPVMVPDMAGLLEPVLSLKEGRVLSAANRAIVQEAIREMGEAIDALEALLLAAEPPSRDDDKTALTAVALAERLRRLRAMELELAFVRT